ncbi:MAG: MarR family transcriptional regulator [Candidatus Omnitrophota bacterium]
MNIRRFSKEISGIMPHIHASLIRALPNEITKGKIGFPQMVIMDILLEKGRCKMSDLSRVIGVTKGAVTGITDRLIAAGLLDRLRSGVDRRIVYTMLTKRGIRISKKIRNHKLNTISALFSSISRGERDQYLRIMKKLQKKMKAKGK